MSQNKKTKSGVGKDIMHRIRITPQYLLICKASGGMTSDAKCHCAGLRVCPYYNGYDMANMVIFCSYPSLPEVKRLTPPARRKEHQ